MNIKSLEFSTIFEDYPNPIKLEDLDYINVFIGKNNSGKTTILKMLFQILINFYRDNRYLKKFIIELNFKELQHLLIQYKDQSHRDKPPYFFPDLFAFVENFFEKYKLSELKEYIHFIFSKKLNKDILSLNIKIENPVNLDLLKDYKILSRMLSDPNRKHFPETLFNLIISQYKVIILPATRKLETSFREFDKKDIQVAMKRLETIFEQGFNSNDILKVGIRKFEEYSIPNFINLLHYIRDGEIEYIPRTFFQIFKDSINKMFPNISLDIESRITDFKSIGSIKEYSRNIGDWKKMGSGTQQLLTILFFLLLPKNFIYLIDEPEVGLHPGLQTQLLNFIKYEVISDKKYFKQFFFATHSTSFIDFSDKISHYLCIKDEEKFTVQKFKKKNLEIIRTELGHTPSSLLQANGIIWVEGPSDFPYVKMLFKCFDVDLDDLRIIIVPYNGAGNLIRKHLSLNLMKSLNPNFFIIMDSDKKNSRDQIRQTRLNVQKEFEEEGYKFWIIKEYREIEGIIPQDALNKYFKVNKELENEYLKKPYEKLEDYIKKIKNGGFTENSSPQYDKTRDASKISKLILENHSYREEICNNNYLKSKIEVLKKEINKWIKLYPSGKVSEIIIKLINELIDPEYFELTDRKDIKRLEIDFSIIGDQIQDFFSEFLKENRIDNLDLSLVEDIIQTLYEIGNTNIIPFFINALWSENEDIYVKAIKFLNIIKWNWWEEYKGKYPKKIYEKGDHNQERVIRREIYNLIDKFSYKSGAERFLILQKIQRLGEIGITCLFSLLNSDEEILIHDDCIRILNKLDLHWYDKYKEFIKNKKIIHILKSDEFNEQEQLKRRLITLLTKYEKNKHDNQKEAEIIHQLGLMFEKLDLLGFLIKSEDTIENNNFQIHLTRGSPGTLIHQFLIGKLENGKIKTPDNVYLSQGYLKSAKDKKKANIQVLKDFIEYLRKK